MSSELQLNEEEEEELSNIVPEIISREEWNARKPRKKRKLVTPVDKVVFTSTRTFACYSKDHCLHSMKNIQNQHMDEMEKSDIRHNFLIGRDGNVYEGRGWTHSCSIEGQIEELHGSCIEVAFIGHELMHPNNSQVKAAFGLIALGMRENFISENVNIYEEELLESIIPRVEAGFEEDENDEEYIERQKYIDEEYKKVEEEHKDDIKAILRAGDYFEASIAEL